MGSGKHRWKISFHRASSTALKSHSEQQEPPKEFVCPISGSLMADPVIVSSGHSFERACVQACKSLGFTPTIPDQSTPDFSAVIPNLALKSTILNWCEKCSIEIPEPLDCDSARNIVRKVMLSSSPEVQTKIKDPKERELLQGVAENPGAKFTHAATELTRRHLGHFHSSSDESVATAVSTPPLQLATRPSCCSSPSSSSEIEILSMVCGEEEEIPAKLESRQVFEQEEAVTLLRKITKTSEDSRALFCTHRTLSALRSLIVSRYTAVQVNAMAALVNLSLEKVNKVKIVRSGIVPLVIDVLKGGFPEAQEHACGTLFSLALDDDNKTAIGVMGALPPLMHALRSERERARRDAAVALYHLTLVQSNRAKLVKLGSVQTLLGMAISGHMTGRILIILCNLAACVDGRAAMLDGGAVECFVGMLRREELESESARESCVGALYSLSLGGLRFKGLAKEAGAAEVLRKVERVGRELAREKARRMLEMMRERERGDDSVDWEALLNSGSVSGTRSRLIGGMDEPGANSTEF